MSSDCVSGDGAMIFDLVPDDELRVEVNFKKATLIRVSGVSVSLLVCVCVCVTLLERVNGHK